MESNLIAHPLAYLRHQRGWSQQDVADIVSAGRNMSRARQKVYRWERGVQPEIDAQYALAESVGVPRELVDANPWPSWLLFADGAEQLDQPWTADNAAHALAGTLGAYMDRRGFLILTGSTGLVSLAPAWAEPWKVIPLEKVARAASGGRVTADMVGFLERRLTELWVIDDEIGGDLCAEMADHELKWALTLLKRGTYTGAAEKRLYSVAAGLCRSAGWGAFDADKHAAADRYWHAGLRAAHQAGDGDAAAYLLSNMALQQNYAGDGKAAIGMLDGARRIIGSGGPKSVHAMLDAWQVRSHAVLGEGAAASRILGRADEHWDARQDDDPSWIYWMRRPSATIEANMALVTLEKANETERHLVQWIAEDGEKYSRDRAFALTVIACAQLSNGQLDQSIGTARSAVAALRKVESGRIADELSKFIEQLPPGERAAQDFREEINELEDR